MNSVQEEIDFEFDNITESPMSGEVWQRTGRRIQLAMNNITYRLKDELDGTR